MKKFISAFIILAPLCITAQTGIQTTKIAIFKNGNFLARKTGSFPVKEKSFTIPAPQKVLYGGFWLSLNEAAGLHSIVNKATSVKTMAPITSKEDLLVANIGKSISYYETHSANSREKQNGEVLAVLKNNDKPIVKLKSADNSIVFYEIDQIGKIEVGGNNHLLFPKESVQNSLVVKTNNEVSSVTLTQISFQEGIQWIPSYQLKILDDKGAVLQMKATIINHSEDLKNTEVDVFAGNPEMFFQELLDPVSLNYLNSLQNYNRRSDLGGSYNNRAFVSQIRSSNYDYSEERETNELVDGEKVEDMFVFRLGNLSLEAQSKTIVPVFTKSVQYEHIYSVSIPEYRASLKKPKPIEVLHQLRITNSGNTPLTSGSVLVLNQNELPMAQSLVEYTPVNSKQVISLAKAIDISVKNEEIDATPANPENKPKSKRSSYLLTRQTTKGEIDLKNFKNKEVTIIISKEVAGIVTFASSQGKIRLIKDQDNDKAQSFVTWEITLAPGEKTTINYSYDNWIDD